MDDLLEGLVRQRLRRFLLKQALQHPSARNDDRALTGRIYEPPRQRNQGTNTPFANTDVTSTKNGPNMGPKWTQNSTRAQGPGPVSNLRYLMSDL